MIREGDDESIAFEQSAIQKSTKNDFIMIDDLPDPPSTVRAIGRHESAEIWWTKDYGLKKGTEILEWEVTRYRKDKKDGKVTWSSKGNMTLYQMGRIHQCVFLGLKNHSEYRFTVTIKTEEGYSMESTPSNIVYIDAPPPVGWKLYYDQSSRQYYYYNEYFRFAQISRPELDPYYIEDCITRCFSKREIRKFKEIWIEEMLHFELMTHTRLKEVLQELGETIPAETIRDHMKAFAGSETEIVTFTSYMNILYRIKRDLIESSNIEKKKGKNKNKKKKKKEKIPPSYEIGDWVAKYHVYANRWHFINPKALFNITDTWDMTWDCRFSMPDEDYDQVYQLFDFGMVERIRVQFDEVNVSKTGVIDAEEFDMFLVAVKAVEWTKDKKRGICLSKFDRIAATSFFRQIDYNDSGHITFNEFCLMLCMLLDKKKTGRIIKKIRQFDYLNVLAENGPVKVPLAPTLYREKLAKLKEKSELLKRIAKKKKMEEKAAAKEMKKRQKKSRKNRKIHYAVSDDESKGDDNFDAIGDDKDIDVNPYASTNYDDEELDELRALAPPKVTKLVACLQCCCCCCPQYLDNALDTFEVRRTQGPHGLFCLCGCRSYLALRDPQLYL